MKKMMMILALLFVMVGSSFGTEGWSWYPSAWTNSNSLYVKAIQIGNDGSVGGTFYFDFLASDGKYYLPDPSMTTEAKKALLASLITIKNSKSQINVYKKTKDEVAGHYYFNGIVIVE